MLKSSSPSSSSFKPLNESDTGQNSISSFGQFSEFIFTERAGRIHNRLVAILFGFVACFVICSNTLVIVGVVRRRIWKVKSMRFFFFLIFSDMLIGLITLPLHVLIYSSTKATRQPRSELIFSVKFLRYFPLLLSIIGVLLIAVDRFLAILKPNIHKTYVTSRFVWLVMIAVSMISATWAYIVCSGMNNTPSTHFISLVTLGVFKSIIFVSVTFIYHVVIKSVRRTANTTRTSFVNAVSSPLRYDRTLSRLSLILTVSFLLCHLPSTVSHFYIANLICQNTRNLMLGFYLVTWTSLPMFLNSGLNGVLLIYGNKKLKKWFLKFTRCVVESIRTCVSPVSPPQRERKNAIVADQTEQKTIQKVVVAFHSAI